MKFATAFLMTCLIMIVALPAWAQSSSGYRNSSQNCSGDCLKLHSSLPLQQLSADEIKWLLYIREEEKLALDVYQALYEKWQLGIFDNIAASEKRHFDAIGALISRYGLPDPAQSAPGSLSESSGLQSLYDALIAEGSLSVEDALKVGVAIEIKDIDDLGDALAITDTADIVTVYTNLLRGSSNHLSAFNSHLQVTGTN